MRLPTYRDLAERFDDARLVRHVMNAWPPFAGAGIHVVEMSADFRHVVVRLRRTPWTSNYVGTQFGGSLYAMTDPFWMIMVLNNLGRGYVVWDKAAHVEYVRPGRTAVTASFDLTDDVLAELRAEAADGAKVLRWFDTDVLDTDGEVVARVRRQLYVRQKR